MICAYSQVIGALLLISSVIYHDLMFFLRLYLSWCCFPSWSLLILRLLCFADRILVFRYFCFLSLCHISLSCSRSCMSQHSTPIILILLHHVLFRCTPLPPHTYSYDYLQTHSSCFLYHLFFFTQKRRNTIHIVYDYLMLIPLRISFFGPCFFLFHYKLEYVPLHTQCKADVPVGFVRHSRRVSDLRVTHVFHHKSGNPVSVSPYYLPSIQQFQTPTSTQNQGLT